MPGLHGSVRLVSVAPISLGDVALVPGLAADGTTGTLDVRVEVELDGDHPAEGWTVDVRVETDRSRRLAGIDHAAVPIFNAAMSRHAHRVALRHVLGGAGRLGRGGSTCPVSSRGTTSARRSIGPSSRSARRSAT